MIVSVMGDVERYGYTPNSLLRRALDARLEERDENGVLLPGMVEDEGETDLSKTPITLLSPEASMQGRFASGADGGRRSSIMRKSSDGGRRSSIMSTSFFFGRTVSHENITDEGEGAAWLPRPDNLKRTGEKGVTFERLKSERGSDDSASSFWMLASYLRGVVIRILSKMHILQLFVRDRGLKQVVSILVTPVKKLERDANKSSKRVHFKLRKKSTVQVFQPLEKSSVIIQTWMMLLVLPMCFDIFAFGIRIAFSDIYRRQMLDVWYMDVACDVWMIADMCVTLVTVVPKGTYPGQTHTG